MKKKMLAMKKEGGEGFVVVIILCVIAVLIGVIFKDEMGKIITEICSSIKTSITTNFFS